MLYYIVLIHLFSLLNFSFSQNWALHLLLSDDYNKLQVPLLNNSKLAVNSSIKINSFAVTEKTQTVKMDIYHCINWTDFRLQKLQYNITSNYTYKNENITEIKLTKFDAFWRPLLFFRNSIDSSVINSLSKVEYMQIWPNEKLIQYCSRLSITFICHMEFANFPFDEHYCNFELESCK